MNLSPTEHAKILENLNKAQAKKEPFGLPIPKTKQTEKNSEILNAASKDEIHAILQQKVLKALQAWAIKKMYPNYEKYLDDGLRFFFFEILTRKVLDEHSTTENLIKETSLTFPLRPRKKLIVSVDPFNSLQEYERVLPIIQKLLKDTRRLPAQRKLTLIKRLNVSKLKADKYVEENCKPSLIALDYVARKNRLPFGAEALKKYIQLARTPEKIIACIREDFEKRTSL
jgi:hypothetical protein